MEICITHIRARSAGAEIVLTVELSDGEHTDRRELVLSTEQYGALKPFRGIITEERFEELESAASLSAAIRRGSNILGYGANSRRALVGKLKQRGFDEAQCEAAAEYLEDHRFLNETEDAAREAEKCVAKLWGKHLVTDYLRSRGYGDETIRSLDDTLNAVDFAANCRALVRKRYSVPPEDPGERRKCYAALMRYGYSASEIRTALADDGEAYAED